MTYVASPYSHPDPKVRATRFEAVCRFAAREAGEGRLVYAPIAHSHPLALHGLPGDWPFWAAHNQWMLAACREVVVLTLPGWQESQGVAAEIEHATGLGLPVRFAECSGVG